MRQKSGILVFLLLWYSEKQNAVPYLRQYSILQYSIYSTLWRCQHVVIGIELFNELFHELFIAQSWPMMAAPVRLSLFVDSNFFLLKMSICCRCHRELSWALSLQLSWALFCAKSSYCIVAAPVRLSLFVNNNLFLLKMSSLSLSSFMSSFMHSFMSSVLRKGVQWWQHLSGFLSSYWRGSQLDTSSSSNREY